MSPYRSTKRLKFIRALPCSVPGCRWKSEVAHIGPHGLGQKAPDTSAVPLCRPHHRELHAWGRAEFEGHYNLFFQAILGVLNEKPRIRLDGMAFVADYAGECYVLVPKASGLPAAIREMCRIRKECLEDELRRTT